MPSCFSSNWAQFGWATLNSELTYSCYRLAPELLTESVRFSKSSPSQQFVMTSHYLAKHHKMWVYNIREWDVTRVIKLLFKLLPLTVQLWGQQLTLWLPGKIFRNCHLVSNKIFRFSSLVPDTIFGFSLLVPDKIWPSTFPPITDRMILLSE